MSDFRASSLIDEALSGFGETEQAEQARTALSDQNFLDTVAVSREQGNDFTEQDGLARDLLEAPYEVLVQRYGEQAANEAIRVRHARTDLQQHRDDSRSIPQAVGDAVLDAGSAFVGLAGNTVGAATVRPLAWAFDVDADLAAAVQADLTSFVQEEIQSFSSDHSQQNARYMGIQQNLDMADNARQAAAELESGDSPFMVSARQMGRDFLDAGANIAQDPGATQELVAGALGSLGPSAALAKGSAIAATKGVQLLTTSARASALAASGAAIVTIGATEASGTYAQTMNDIMNMPEAEISQSTVYAGLLEEGYSDQEARVALANMTAETAFLANLPAATAFGVLTRRFETAPIGSFKGSGVIDGLRTITAQSVEEAGQGAASAASQNFALDSTAGIETDIATGVGQSAAEGFVGGLGQAGVASVPATAVGTVNAASQARDALLQETTFNDPLTQDILGQPSVAQRTAQTARSAGNAVASGVRGAAQAASPVVAYAADVINKTEAGAKRETVQDALDLNETIQDEVSRETLAPEVVEAMSAPEETTVSEGFAGLTGSNVVETVAGITAKLSERGFRPTEADTVFAASQLERLSQVAESLPAAAKRQVGKILSSNVARKIQSDAAKVDLNKETPAGDITPQEVSTTVNVAKTNPANVNPDRTDQILEESGENISEQDLKITRAASKISRVINDNVDSRIEIERTNGVTLTQSKSAAKKGQSVEDTSRSIQAVGYERNGKKLRSVNDFAADIIKGIQSPEGVALDRNGVSVPVRQVAKEMNNFVQHMLNRVEALNVSFDNNRVNQKSGKLTGSPEKFRGLVDADNWVEAENWTGSPVSYHRGSPGSVAFAQQVENDMNTGLQAYEALKAEFPEVFDGLPDLVPVALKKDDAQSDSQNTTAIDDVDTSSEARAEGDVTTEEQNQTQEQSDTTSQTIDEASPDAEEQNQQGEITTDAPDIAINGDDTIVDDDENPVVFYHGTNAVFSTFRDGGIFLTTRKGLAREFARGDGTGTPRLISMNVKLGNPLTEEVPEGMTPQDFWLANSLTLEQRKSEGRYDSIMLFQDTEAMVIAEGDHQIEQIDPDVDGTLSEEQKSQIIDEDSNSEEAEVESGSPEPVETDDTQEIESEEQPLNSSDTWQNIVAELTGEEKARLREKTNELRNNTRSYIKEMLGDKLAKKVRQIRIMPLRADGVGHARFDEQEIRMREDLFNDDGSLNALGRTVAVHEAAHLVDHTNVDENIGKKPISSRRTFYKGGKVFNEMKALAGSSSDYFNARLEYAFSRDNQEAVASELFAVASEMYFSEEEISGDLTETAALMEDTYGETDGTAVGVQEEVQTTDGEQESGGTSESTSDVQGDSGTGATEQSSDRRVNPEFSNHFNEKGSEDHPKNLGDFLTTAREKGVNEKTLEFVESLVPVIREAMAARLQRKVKDGGVTQSVLKHIQDGRTQFRRFKAGLLVDPETGQYDQNMLDLATVAMADWLLTNTGSNPNRLEDTLEKLGVSISEITDSDFNAILKGVPPSGAADTLAADIMRMWDVSENVESGIDDLDGVAQGFAKEMFSALSDSTELLTVEDVTLLRDGEEVKTQTILVQNQELKDIRKEVQGANGVGVKLTSKEGLFGDRGPVYSIGEKIAGTANRQNRSNVQLSGLERRALKKMQDTPNYLDETVATVLSALGEGVQRMLGYREDVETIENEVLRRSVRGKNASILTNIDETVSLVDALPDADTPVYFPVGVTKVGRHQYQGPNPQSNKVMRAVTTPTWSTVSLNNLDNFWIAIGQASDISGINKAEKLSHADIVEKAPELFYQKYGEAVAQIKDVIRGGEVDQEAFAQAMGVAEMQQLKAVIAVAQMEIAAENGESNFRTSLSFELDGLTNGVANMMVNFGQGEITQQDYFNFKRVGFFLGQVGKSVNSFFAEDGALDMYETTSRTGDQMIWEGMKNLEPWQQEQRKAAGRLATSIGNFEIGEDGQFKMTRNTAKNPMTKVNYGSGVRGVAVGVADDMLLSFYEKMQDKPADVSLDDYFYSGFSADMETMGLSIPANLSKATVFNQEAVKNFQTRIQYTIGETLTEATKSVIGEKINQLNDLMVFSTNVQSQYLRNIYNQRLEELGERLANEGVIKKTAKGVPQYGQIPRKYFRELEAELSQLAPIFTSDEQTLAIGGFAKQLSDLVTSSNYDERLNQKARMPLPDDVGVRAIPFSVIGSGDAMMMNLIFGSEGAPNDVLGIFDGLDIPLEKIQEYAPYVNEQVAKSWDRDVLSMAILNFSGFMNEVGPQDENLLNAFKEVADNNKNTSVTASNPEELMVQLNQRLRENQARKKVFKELAISVDQMGGSDIGYSRDGAELGLNEINTRIARVLEQKPQDLQESVTEPVFESTVDAVLSGLRLTSGQKKVLEVIRPSLPNTRVVMGTVDQLRDWRNENIPDDGNVLSDAKGMYDATNDIIFLTTSAPDTILHEMVHVATYAKVLDHYNGQTNDAVTRMEDLMQEFLDIDGGQNVRDAQAAILRNLNQSTPEKQAAAVNEFMAYALTNSRVSSKLKDTQTKSLASLKSKVIRLLRRLMGGIPEDMFSHVVFNTKIIVDPPLDTQEGGDGGNGDGGSGNGELTPTADNYTNYWINQLAAYIDSLDIKTPEGARRSKSTAQDILNADKVLDDLRQVGLLRNPEDRQTFRAIYGIIKSEMILDPNSLIALTKVFQHVEENMTPEMFGNDTEANNTYSSILNSFGGFQNGETSDAVAVLFALSQTSSKFREVLDQIPEPETQAPGSGLNAFLARGTNIFMKKVMGSLDDGAPVEVLDGLKQTLIEADREKEYAVLRRVTNTLDQADQYVSGKFTQVAEFMRKTDRETKKNSAKTVRQYLISSVTAVTNFLDRPGSELNAEAAQRSVHMGLPVLSIVPIRELVDEFVGTNRENKDFVAMMDIVNSKISGLRQAYREQLPGILSRQFQTEPNAEQWASMQKTLAATDFTSLVDINNMQRSMQLLEESGTRQNRIQNVESQLQQKLVPYVFQDAKDKAQQLADFMNGQGAGKLLVRNAYAIAKNLDGNFDETLVPLIDELISLYAIDGMDSDVREETVQLWQNEPQAITAMVSYIQGLNEAEDQKSVSEAAKLNGYKGYIPNIGKDNHRVIVALDADENELIHRGYKKISPFEGEIDSVFPRSYYVTNISQQGMYSQGIMQNVASTYRGVDVNTGLSVTGDTAGFISGGGSVERVVEKMNDESYVLENPKETLIPVFDGDGSVMGFERTVNPDVADAFLGRDENLATNLGAWAGRQVEEELSTQYNRALIDKLDDLYQTRDEGTDDQFVNLKSTKDPIYKESFKLIPQEIKSYADSKFDGTGMMVPESMVNLSVGYREASVADLWTGKTRMPEQLVKATRAVTKLQFGNTSLRTLLVKGESIGQGVISDAKDIIVIKSLVVPVANTQANIIQLSTNGVPNKTIVKSYRTKLAEITEYNKNVTKLIELRAEQRLTPNSRRKRLLDDKIQVIEDLNARMSIAPMIAAGAYKQLSEGITDVDVAQTNGGLADYMESLADKLPDTVSSVLKIGLVSKSTSIYKAANRATQYGDFLAKSIYYDHLISQGLSEVDAIAKMNEEFVNFSALPGRTRSLLERNGLTWFMNFKIRIAKIAAKQMRENPVRALALNAALDVGSPIQDNIFSVIGDGRMDYATGYEMLFGAPELNPWVNLMSN